LCEIPRQNSLEQSVHILINEGQEGKTCLYGGVRGRVNGEGEEGEYGGYILYMCMKIEQ
jgi:hypothetical protein